MYSSMSDYLKNEIDHAVTVLAIVLNQRTVRCDGAGDDETD